MFYNKFDARVDVPVSAIMHQLSDKELQETYGIIHDIKVSNIILNKEDLKMIEKLEAYLAELEAKHTKVAAEDFTALIDEEVVSFRATREAQLEHEREEALAKIASDIDCITNLIAIEKSKVAEEAVLTADTVITE